MNELIPIDYDGEQPMISARDLHKALGIKERFSAWFARYSDCFEKEVDFTGVGKPTSVNNGVLEISKDYKKDLNEYGFSYYYLDYSDSNSGFKKYENYILNKDFIIII